MTVKELIEKHAPDHVHSNDTAFARAHLKTFAIELLRSIEPTRQQAKKASGCYLRALDTNYWKALEELRK